MRVRGGRQPAQPLLPPFLVVLTPPGLDDDPGVGEAHEPLLRQSGGIAGFGAFLILAFIAANDAIATTGIAIFTMTILTLVDEPPNDTLPYRLALTVLAAMIALTFA